MILGAIVVVASGEDRSFATRPATEIPSIGRVVLVGKFARDDRCDGEILYGDFDGDGRRDYAYPIKEIVNTVARRYGVRVHLTMSLASDRDDLELGAGQAVSNGQSDLAGVDFWRLVPHAELKKLWPGTACPRGDGILVEKRDSYSGVLGVSKGHLAWRWLRRVR
jgi:hypothetical protein